MAAMDHAENPYHVSFKLCAEEVRKGGDDRVIASQKAQNSRYRDTFYDEYLKTKLEFHCDLCDRSFRNRDHLNAHNAEHVTCGREGCTFTAHEKIVATHVRVQHATGIFGKIKKLNNPEETKKWLAERKRKYPTLKVTENRKKLEAAKKRRGETIEAPKDRFNRDFNKRKGGKCGKTAARGRTRNTISKIKTPRITKFIDDERPENLCNGGIPAFKGLGSLEPEVDKEMKEETIQFDISDEEEIQGNKAEPQISQPVIGNSLGLLMNAYDSDATDDEEELKKPPESVPPVTQPIPASDDEAPEEVPTSKSTVQTLSEPSTRRVKTARKRKGKRIVREDRTKRPFHVVRHPRKPTLLQKLLTPDINRERNIVRECVHYIVQENFFHEKTENPDNIFHKQAEKPDKLSVKPSQETRRRKPRLLQKLLKEDIVHERNLITQCVRFIVDNNFFDQAKITS